MEKLAGAAVTLLCLTFFLVSLSCNTSVDNPSLSSKGPDQERVRKENGEPDCHGEILGFNLTNAYRIPGNYPNVQFNLNWAIGCDYGWIYGYTFDIERISPNGASFWVDEFVIPHPPCEPCLYFRSFVVSIEDPNPKMAEVYRIRLVQTWLDGHRDFSEWVEFPL